MEHATEAFMMAFGVFTLVIALSISISLLGQVNACSTSILGNIDKTNDYLYVESNKTERKVGIEDIIPTIYRAYNENYRIEFYYDNATNDPYVLYEVDLNKDTDFDDTGEKINTIDLENEAWPDINMFLKDLIYGYDDTTSTNKTHYDINKIQIDDSNGLYSKLNNKTITEYLGEYYIEDVEAGPTGSTVEEINKTKKRIIVYKIKP